MAEVAERQLDSPVAMGTFMTWQHLQFRRRGGWMIVLAVGLAGVGTAWPRYPRGEAAQPSAESPAKAEAPLPLQGAVSCASMACHNGFGPAGSKGSEYTTWIGGEDKHTRAYQILSNERSRRIETNLGNHRNATEDALCLNCHVHPQASTMSSETLALVKEDGVSCESCHGAAGGWRTVHYLAGWRQKSIGEKKAYGMKPTKDLVERAKACAVCHVGDGIRDVNHDLIAAGHPRLNFEFSAYHDLMPKHWDEAAEKQTYPDLEARLWVIGQLATAEAALKLLAYRANAHQPAPPGLTKAWPEFAEYQCYACHHDLEVPSWRLEREERLRASGGEKAKFGALPWGTWYYPLLSQAAGDWAASLGDLSRLRAEMRKPLPGRQEVARQAQAIAQQLDPWARQAATGRARDGADLQHLFGAIARDEKVAAANWDGAAQVYLALAALYHAQEDLGSRPGAEKTRKYLETMRKELEFPESPVRYDSPVEKTYPPREARFLEALKAINQLDR